MIFLKCRGRIYPSRLIFYCHSYETCPRPVFSFLTLTARAITIRHYYTLVFCIFSFPNYILYTRYSILFLSRIFFLIFFDWPTGRLADWVTGRLILYFLFLHLQPALFLSAINLPCIFNLQY